MDDHQLSIAEQIQDIIDSSSLGADDQQLLLERLPLLPSEVQETLVKLFQEDPSNLEMLVENLKMKLDTQDNPDQIAEIVEKEKEEITRVLNQD